MNQLLLSKDLLEELDSLMSELSAKYSIRDLEFSAAKAAFARCSCDGGATEAAVIRAVG